MCCDFQADPVLWNSGSNHFVADGCLALKSSLFGFLFAMWLLILLGGGILVMILGPISVSEFGELNWLVGSVIQATMAIILVAAWIFILSKIKNLIFKNEIKS
jgi:acyl CoA:acetate/3-ketoacid CoA transferase beta subunit